MKHDSSPEHRRYNSGANRESSKNLMTSRGFYKRSFDLTVLILAHVLLLPVWIALWILIPALIWLGDRGPVFYRHQSGPAKDAPPDE